MVQHSLGYVWWRDRSQKESIKGFFEGRDIVDQFRNRFDVGIEPLLDDFDLIGEVDSRGTVTRAIQRRLWKSSAS